MSSEHFIGLDQVLELVGPVIVGTDEGIVDVEPLILGQCGLPIERYRVELDEARCGWVIRRREG